MGRRLNLEEIGRLAGVSRSTVSRVVNGASNVSDEAKARVEAVVAQTGYHPNAAARSLAWNRAGVGGVTHGSSVGPAEAPTTGRVVGVADATDEVSDATCVDHGEPQPIVSPNGPIVCTSCGSTIGATT